MGLPGGERAKPATVVLMLPGGTTRTQSIPPDPPELASLPASHFFLSPLGPMTGLLFPGKHRRSALKMQSGLELGSYKTELAKSLCPRARKCCLFSLSLFLTHTQTHTPCIPLYPLCRPPKHHKITASDREIRNPLLLSFTLIKVSNSLPNSRGSARQSYGNFGSANSWSQKDRHCFCGVGVFAIKISIYADPELMCCPMMYHQAYNAACL